MPSTLETQSVTGEAKISPLAGKPAPKELSMDVARLEKEYFSGHRAEEMGNNALGSSAVVPERGVRP